MLQSIYPGNEALKLMEIIFDELLEIPRLKMISEPEARLSESEMLKIHHAVKKLLDYTPVQHVTESAYFFDLKLKVNKHVLIPRPETEELVEWILNTSGNNRKLDVLDIGTGSGAIAIALKNAMPFWNVTAIDKSIPALDVAKINAGFHNLNIHFLVLDILQNTAWKQLPVFDIIVSNPPYVTESDKKMMHPNVLNYEPEAALYVSDEAALIFYRKILDFAEFHLKNGGKLFFEINERFGDETRLLYREFGYSNIEIRQDLQGKDRMACGVKLKNRAV
jgi:release factor glutamine methyltransferase